MADLNPIDAAQIARSTGNLLAVLADQSYLAPMRDGQYRLREPLPDGLRRSVLRRDRFTCCDCRQAWSPDRSDLFCKLITWCPWPLVGRTGPTTCVPSARTATRTSSIGTQSPLPVLAPG
jgi:hypothetical protein